MNFQSRIINTFRNTFFGIISQAILILLNFGTRTVFIKFLNENYLGVNGLFSNILSMLSLVELGIGSAIIYSMYKPLAENNKKEIAALMNFYKKVYNAIGIIVTILGILLIPFLGYIVNNTNNIKNLEIIYLLFLLNTSISYFFSYKRSIISADQKEFILSKYRMYFSFIKAFLQISVLYITRNFLIYLIAQIMCTFLENVFVSIKADKMYPYLKVYHNEKISSREKNKIKDNVKALTIYKIGGTLLDSTDNILISSLLNVGLVGLLSNYTLITGSLSMVLTQFSNSVTASVGNFVATESNDRHVELLQILTFIQFIFYGFSFVCLSTLLNRFITIWIGEKYLLDFYTVLIIALNFYIVGILSPVWTFRTTMGLFKYGKYRPIFTAIINLVISIALGKSIGIIGVLLGTTISRLFTNVWFDPYIVYKYGFKEKCNKYLMRMSIYVGVCLIDIFIIKLLLNKISYSFIGLILALIINIIVFIISILFFYKTFEFKYLVNKIRQVLSKFIS